MQLSLVTIAPINCNKQSTFPLSTKSCNMFRSFILFILLCSCISTYSQNTPTTTPKTANVIVTVTDRKQIPANREEILFRAMKSELVYKGLTGKDGKFSIILPAGDQYVVNVKSLNDTTAYGKIDIAMPGPDQFYSEPFKVDIEFEPAKRYTLDNVHFDFAKATLRPESFPELEELFTFLKRKETVKVEIAGHTDNIGKEEDNLRLSLGRANAIRNYLLKKGIAPTRINAKGYGSKEVVADNNSEEGRQLNRRTEVIIL